MTNKSNLQVAIYKSIEIDKALSAYHKEHRMVKSLSDESLFVSDVCVQMEHYPFTQVSMPYASINLINLAIEQSLIVMYDRLVLTNSITGPWDSIDDYRSYVSQGCWLVPRLVTKVLSPTPLRTELNFVTSLDQIKTGKRRVALRFSVNCRGYVDSSGVAIFDAKQVYLRSMG